MNTYRMLVATATVGFLFAVCAQAEGIDPNMPKDITIKGKVEVTKDANGVITSVIIKSWEKTFHVPLDAKGMELGGMEGKHVKATGMVSKKDLEVWLTVASFEEHKPKEKTY